jgi:hypothetical protein
MLIHQRNFSQLVNIQTPAARMRKATFRLAGDMLETISVSDFSLFTSFLYFLSFTQNNHACI